MNTKIEEGTLIVTIIVFLIVIMDIAFGLGMMDGLHEVSHRTHSVPLLNL